MVPNQDTQAKRMGWAPAGSLTCLREWKAREKGGGKGAKKRVTGKASGGCAEE